MCPSKHELCYYVPSAFVIFYKRRGLKALFHTINKTLLPVSKKRFNFVRNLFRKRNVASRLDPRSIKQEPFLKFLLKKHFIVSDRSIEKESVFSILKKNVLKKPHPVILYILPTLKCNFKCGYCFIRKNAGEGTVGCMKIAVLKKGLKFFANKCVKRGTKTIIFYGGEPLLNYSLVKRAILQIRRMESDGAFGTGKLRIAINTNGSLLTDDKIDFFKANDCLLSVSLDGNKELNDMARLTVDNAGTFIKTSEALDKMIARDMPIAISFTIGKHNIDNLPKAVRCLHKRFNGAKFGFNLMFCDRNISNSFFVPTKKLMKKLRVFYRNIEANGIYEGKLFSRKKRAFEPFSTFNHCNAYGKQIVLLPNGKIGPCQAFAGTSNYFAKLTKQTDIDFDPMWKEWTGRCVFQNKKCRNCKLVLLCGGGCAYNAYVSQGCINGIDELNCKFAKLLLDEIIYLKLKKSVANLRLTE